MRRMIGPAYALLLIGACTVFDPLEGWSEFTPPDQYRFWHAEVQTCVLSNRSFDDIIWRKVHAYVFHCGDRDDAIGCLDLPNTIYLAQLTLNAPLVVKAELIHYVRQNGLHDALFERCRRG